MWAFVIHDRAAGRLFGSRDRFGKKPFFYAQTPEVFAFASELTALRRHPALVANLDPASLRKYFAYGFVPAPRTLFSGFCKLPAGQVEMIEVARQCGASAKFAGSGGAIVGLYQNPKILAELKKRLGQLGCSVEIIEGVWNRE